MNPWPRVRERIEKLDPDGVATLVAGLSEPDRKVVARELSRYLPVAYDALYGFGAGGEVPAEVAELRRRWPWSASGNRARSVRVELGLRLSVVACLGGAGAVVRWLTSGFLGYEGYGDEQQLAAAWRHRPAEWRQDVVRRLAARLRPTSVWQQQDVWLLVRALADPGHGLPDSDGLVCAWVQFGHRRTDLLRDDPWLDQMVPRLFTADGVGSLLHPRPEWLDALVGLSRQGRIPRKVLLDGCVERFLGGGTNHRLKPFVTLYRELDPSLEEIPARDLTRLLPAAPGLVANLAGDGLRKLDEAGLLDDDLFGEAVAALVFRTEKKAVRTALSWIKDSVSRRPDRADAGVAAAVTVFDHDAVTLQHGAVRTVAALAGHLSDAGRAAVRDAAGQLPADLAAELARTFGELPTERRTEDPPVLPGPPVRPRPAPVASLDDLVQEIRRCACPQTSLAELERVLAGLVDVTAQDPEAARRRLWECWDDQADVDGWLAEQHRAGHLNAVPFDPRRVVLAVVAPDRSRKLSRGRETVRTVWAGLAAHDRHVAVPQPYRLRQFVAERIGEITECLAAGRTVPVLLATPTEATGHVDPDTLVERMRRYEAAAVLPLPSDVQQALLRLPRRVDPNTVARADRLTSPAGRELADWLRRGGIPDPEFGYELAAQVVVSCAPGAGPLPPLVAKLWDKAPQPFGAGDPYAVWGPSILPSHREVAAAHLWDLVRYGLDSADPAPVYDLALGEGPIGMATAA